MNLFKLAAAAVAAATLTAGAASAQSDDLASFYKGNTVTILIGHPPGGSYDLYAQLAAAHLGDFIPGHPNVIVQSMPGGGGSLAAAYFANRAPTDGTYLGLFPESLAAEQLTDPDKTKWDMHDMKYIGRFADVRSVIMVNKDSPIQTVDDLKTKESTDGCTGHTSGSSRTGAVLKYFMKLDKMKMVCGYEGSSAVILALLRNEVDMTASVWTTWTVNNGDDIKNGTIKPLVQFGLEPIEAIKDVPMASDLVDDPAAKSAIKFFSASGELGRSLLATPGLDDAKYAMFTKAFDDMTADADFLADAKKRNLPLDVWNAAKTEEAKADILNASKDDISLLQTAMEEGFK